MPHRGIRAPKGTEYTSFLVTDRFDIHSESLTYHCNRLNAHNKGIRDQISRVGFGILLPELTENVLRGTHAIMMSDKVAFEETVKDAGCIYTLVLATTSTLKEARFIAYIVRTII